MREKVEEVMRCKKTWEKDGSRSTEEQTEDRHTKEVQWKVDKGRAGEKGVYTSRAGEKRYTQVGQGRRGYTQLGQGRRGYTQVGRRGEEGIHR